MPRSTSTENQLSFSAVFFQLPSIPFTFCIEKCERNDLQTLVVKPSIYPRVPSVKDGSATNSLCSPRSCSTRLASFQVMLLSNLSIDSYSHFEKPQMSVFHVMILISTVAIWSVWRMSTNNDLSSLFIRFVFWASLEDLVVPVARTPNLYDGCGLVHMCEMSIIINIRNVCKNWLTDQIKTKSLLQENFAMHLVFLCLFLFY